MRILFLVAFMTIGAWTSNAVANDLIHYNEMPAGTYELDKTHASLVWKVSHLGLADYTARFASFDASFDFNPESPADSKVTATIDPMSIRTDYPNKDEKDFDKKLSEDESWFNAGQFPVITFESTSININDDGKTGTMTGNLTMFGVSKPVTMDVIFNGAYLEKPFASVPAMGFSAKGTLTRSEWGFDTYVPNIGDVVTFMIEAEFHKAADE